MSIISPPPSDDLDNSFVWRAWFRKLYKSVSSLFVLRAGDTMTGSLGVGVAPGKELDVLSEIRVQNPTYPKVHWYQSGAAADSGKWQAYVENTTNSWRLVTLNDAESVEGNVLFVLTRTGNAGIGMAPTTKLDVNGVARSTQLRVDTAITAGWALDASNATTTIASGATATIVGSASGLLVLNDQTVDGSVCLALVGGGNTAVVAQVSGGGSLYIASSTPAVGQVGIFYDGVALLYKIKNNTAASRNFSVCSLKTRASV